MCRHEFEYHFYTSLKRIVIVNRLLHYAWSRTKPLYTAHCHWVQEVKNYITAHAVRKHCPSSAFRYVISNIDIMRDNCCNDELHM